MRKQDGLVQHIVTFTEKEVTTFLKEHDQQKFYAFAYDVNVETKGIYLSFNTEEAFKDQLRLYQKSEFSNLYHDEEYIRRLRYNPGDWKYQNFVSIEFIYDAKIKELFDVVLDIESGNLMNFAEAAMVAFKKTDVYAQIPKTKDFVAFCISHEEDELEALSRVLTIH